MQAQEEVTMIKGMRSKRPRPTSPLTFTMATTPSSSTAELNGGGFGGGGIVSEVSWSTDSVTPSPSNSGVTHIAADEEEEDMANCLILLAKGQGQRSSQPVAASGNTVAAAAVEAYQCKTCNKCFPSFQALGGHRASHKKPNKPINPEETKPLIREKQEDFVPNRENNTILSLDVSNNVSSFPSNKSRVHECSICGAEFGSGQALGGHMRRHRQIQAAPSSSHSESGGVKRPRNLLSLDLNLPAPEEHPESEFPFAPKEQILVFSASPLIDCHY